MTYLIKYVFEIKQKPKHVQHDYRNKWIENIKEAYIMQIQVKGGITTNVDVSVKIVMYIKKIIFAILVHVFVKIDKI